MIFRPIFSTIDVRGNAKKWRFLEKNPALGF